MRRAALSLLLMVMLAGCSSSPGLPKGTVGGTVGAVIGGFSGMFIGSGTGQLVAIALGAMLGGGAGYYAENYLSDTDIAMMDETVQHALKNKEIGSAAKWRNEATGNSGAVIPTQTYRNWEGKLCREYYQQVKAGEGTFEEMSVACRKPDGTWLLETDNA